MNQITKQQKINQVAMKKLHELREKQREEVSKIDAFYAKKEKEILDATNRELMELAK